MLKVIPKRPLLRKVTTAEEWVNKVKKNDVQGASTQESNIAVVRDVISLRQLRFAVRSKQRRVALVPTMGALHQGHLDLIRSAARENHEVYVSIYVNPTQFGVNEDLDTYPKTWQKDYARLRNLNEVFKSRDEYIGRVTTIFRPSTDTMYPGPRPTSEIDSPGSFVTITPLATKLEGASRPVFFRGVATVMMKLLNIVQPQEVIFGQKDIQQVMVIRRMMKDFHVATKLVVCPTTRENDGLAMSSRNVYLGKRRREIATVLHKALSAASEAWNSGKRARSDILGPALELIHSIQESQNNLQPSQRVRFELDYISLADLLTMEEIEKVTATKCAVLSAAIIMLPLEEPGKDEDNGVGGGTAPVRLIDNCILGPNPPFELRIGQGPKVEPESKGVRNQARESDMMVLRNILRDFEAEAARSAQPDASGDTKGEPRSQSSGGNEAKLAATGPASIGIEERADEELK
ncbi:pantothenate synthase [Ptychographa xylographoides]|nr:pantothenate synthase [Ptychographa xylographoides]